MPGGPSVSSHDPPGGGHKKTRREAGSRGLEMSSMFAALRRPDVSEACLCKGPAALWSPCPGDPVRCHLAAMALLVPPGRLLAHPDPGSKAPADFRRGSPRGRQHPQGWRPSPGPGPPGKTEPVSGGRPLHRRVMLVQRLGAEQVVQTGCGCGGRGGRRRRRRCCWRGCLRNGRGGRHGVAVLTMAGQILQRQGLAGRRRRVCLMTVAARA